MTAKYNNLIKIHSAVLLFGLSGLFGKFLAISPITIVWGRVFFSSIFLFLLIIALRKTIKLNNSRHLLYLILMGVILAVHWTTFFRSIQVSTVAIGLLTFSTFPVFVAFLEPVFFQEQRKLTDIVLALVTLLGVLLIIPRFELGNSLTEGVIWGVISGFTFAILSMLNRKFSQVYSGMVIAFYEQLVATLVLIPFCFRQIPAISSNDLGLLILLGVVFTGIAHSLFITGLTTIKTRTAGIISCLEPVYGITFAAIIIGEIPTFRELCGGMVILSAVIYSTWQGEGTLKQPCERNSNQQKIS